VPRAFAGEIEREVSVLEAFADLAAVTLVRARLADESERARRDLEVANAELARAREEIAQHLARRTAELQSTKLELEATRAELRRGEGLGLLVGASEPMRKLYARIERVRDIDVPALIVGESGTGKELVARAIHDTGARAKQPFLPINCGAIAPNLLESELFGHERGAFTGAERARLGIFREARGGTVFLDEIGELPLAMQAAFLRVLQERKVRPLGGRDEFAVEARIVVATNRDLRALVAEGKFREDLYYRLNVVELAVPPLRTRGGDLALLVDHFLQRFANVHGHARIGIERSAVEALAARSWPGNVRQLEHALLQAWLLADGPVLTLADFADAPEPPRRPAPVATESERHERERHAILEALEATGWNRQAAAVRLGIPRRTFYRRLEAYGILTARSHGDA
jgi:serine/threonine-protein kinase PknK